jgi:hypothetical protein
MGNLLAALIPRTAMVPAVEPKNLHPDPAVVAAYEADTLVWHGPLRVRTANELLKVRLQTLLLCLGTDAGVDVTSCSR